MLYVERFVFHSNITIVPIYDLNVILFANRQSMLLCKLDIVFCSESYLLLLSISAVAINGF